MGFEKGDLVMWKDEGTQPPGGASKRYGVIVEEGEKQLHHDYQRFFVHWCLGDPGSSFYAESWHFGHQLQRMR